MATDMCTRRLTRELQALRKEPMKNPTITAMPQEENILHWHFVIEGSKGTPYESGIYHGKLVFPKEYPMKPPSVSMLTPSGRFTPNRRLCLSMSDFHPETWNPMWSVSTILTGLYSFMIETAPTLGSIETSEHQKRRLARQSLEFNMRDPNFTSLFPEYVQVYKDRELERPAEADIRQGDNQLLSTDGAGAVANEEMQGFVTAAAGLIALLSIVFAFRFL